MSRRDADGQISGHGVRIVEATRHEVKTMSRESRSRPDPRDVPNYSPTEAARFLGLPTSTLRSWTRGWTYRTESGEERRGEPLIELHDSAGNELSFTNLVEAHVLSAIRRHHGVSMPRVRQALDYIDRHLGTRHPLARQEFQTDGVDLFVEHLGQLVRASKDNQVILADLLRAHLRRIERDEKGLARRLFLFTRSEGSDQPPVVVIDPRISFGRPVLAGTGIPTEILAGRFNAGESIEELAEDYGCEGSLIQEAIRIESRAA
jgi:uncharacterized protein (DUF433 family)